jgi:hypothetical protein
MSTIPILLAHEAAEPSLLSRFKPRLVGRERESRKLTVHPDIHRWLYSAQTDPQIEYRAKVRVHLAQFVKGQPIDDRFFMKRIEDRRRSPWSMDHGVWAISPRFNPQHRLFGCFATLDWFVVLTKQSRDRLDESENRWHEQIDRCRRIWNTLFPSELPHVGSELVDYISSNAEHCDERW